MSSRLDLAARTVELRQAIALIPAVPGGVDFQGVLLLVREVRSNTRRALRPPVEVGLAKALQEYLDLCLDIVERHQATLVELGHARGSSAENVMMSGEQAAFLAATYLEFAEHYFHPDVVERRLKTPSNAAASDMSEGQRRVEALGRAVAKFLQEFEAVLVSATAES